MNGIYFSLFTNKISVTLSKCTDKSNKTNKYFYVVVVFVVVVLLAVVFVVIIFGMIIFAKVVIPTQLAKRPMK